MSVDLFDEIDRTLADELKRINPGLCRTIDDFLSKGGSAKAVTRICMRLIVQSGGSPLHTTTAQSMIEAYAAIKANEIAAKAG